MFFIKKQNKNQTPFLHKISCLGSFELWIPFPTGTREWIRDKVVENEGLLSSLSSRPPCAEASPELETVPALLGLRITILQEFI